jgi:polyisoprenoid-binding protein YceI
VIRDTAPPEASLPDVETTIDPAAADFSDADGTWVAVAGPDRFAGYRIEELFGGDTVSRTAVGRTEAVEATVTIDGNSVTDLTVTADLTQLESDQARRERYLQNSALEISTFGTATFEASQATISTVPVLGEPVEIDVTGTLTLHGVSNEVTVPVEARWNGDSIDLAGIVEISLADHGIEPPDIGGFVSVEDTGFFEFQLRLEPA